MVRSALPQARQLLALVRSEINMAKHSARHVILSETATFDRDSGDLRAIIETPKGSRNKYRYDPECDGVAGRDDISVRFRICSLHLGR
jgi:hypothetical protein